MLPSLSYLIKIKIQIVSKLYFERIYEVSLITDVINNLENKKWKSWVRWTQIEDTVKETSLIFSSLTMVMYFILFSYLFLFEVYLKLWLTYF